jgi:hypothetical protein
MLSMQHATEAAHLARPRDKSVTKGRIQLRAGHFIALESLPEGLAAWQDCTSGNDSLSFSYLA